MAGVQAPVDELFTLAFVFDPHVKQSPEFQSASNCLDLPKDERECLRSLIAFSGTKDPSWRTITGFYQFVAFHWNRLANGPFLALEDFAEVGICFAMLFGPL